MRARTAILVAAGLVVLYLGAVNNHWAPKQDSGLYLSLGRSLVRGEGMTYQGRSMWGLPPGLPLIIAGSRMLVGDDVWPLNLLASLFGLGVAATAYLAARRLAGDLPPALAAGLAGAVLVVVGLSARLYVDAARILTDVPFTCLVWVGLYAAMRARDGHWAWHLAGAAALAAATMLRLPGLVFFVGFLVATLLEARRRARPGWLRSHGPALLAAALLVAGTFLAWFLLVRPLRDPGTSDHLSQVGPGRWLDPALAGQLLDGLVRVPSAVCGALVGQKLAGVDLVMTALVAVGAWVAARHRQWMVLVAPVLYVGMLGVRHHTSIAPRYFLPIMPILAYLLLLGVQHLALVWRRRAERRRQGAGAAPPAGPPRPSLALVVAAAVCAAVSTPKVVRELYWMRHPDFYAVFDGGRWKDYREMSEYLRARGGAAGGSVLTPMATVVHYWTERPCATEFEWRGERYAHMDALAPGEFAAMAAEGPYAFVALPADEGAWSRDAAAAMAATGRFRPAETFGDLALFARTGPAPTTGSEFDCTAGVLTGSHSQSNPG
jgi:hypothetical protein